MLTAVVCRDGAISEGFGKATEVIIYEIDRTHEIVKKECIAVEGEGHLPVAGILIRNAVHAVICDKIGFSAFEMMKNLRAHVFSNVTGDPDEAIAKLLKRELTELKELDCDHPEDEAGCTGNCASCAYH